ncbi:MAG: PAS domain S-box protein [Chloroflexaceae bacterium]
MTPPEGDIAFRSMFDVAAIGAALVALDGRLLRVNCALCGTVGYAEHELLSATLQTLTHPDDWDRSNETIRQLLADETYNQHLEQRFLHKLGHPIWTLTSLALIRDARGDPQAFFVQIQDITERKQAEQRQHEREQRFRTMFDQSLQFIGLLNPDGTLLEINQTALSVYGLTSTDMLHRPFWETPWWSHSPAVQQRLKATIRQAAQGTPAQCEVDMPVGTDDLRIFDFSIKPVYDAAGQITTLILEGYDVTGWKYAEAALRESEERFHRAFDYASIGMTLVSPNGRWLKVNPAFCDLVGYPESELLTMEFQSITYPDDLDSSVGHMRRLLAGESPYFHLEKRYIHRDGHIVWVLLSVALVCDAQNQPLYAVVQAQNITQHKRARQELARRVSELAHSNAELEQFAYVASHDLQEPLRKIASYTELLARRYQGKIDPGADKFIGYIVDGANRMQQLINDLLTYSRVGRTTDLTMENVELGQIMEGLFNDLARTIRDSQAEITCDELPVVLGHPRHIAQLLQNMITNAIKFRGDAPPRVHISAERRADAWVIAVRDNGIGIAPEYAERIFVVFQRLHTRTEYPGTGIGLAICKKIVERHGGQIWVEAQPGQGSTFFFTLPASQNHIDQGEM